MAGRIKIVTLMTRNVANFVDPRTGEVNATTLAEFTCDELDDYDPGFEIPEKYFDFAFYVSERHEITTGVRSGSMARLEGFINSLPSDYF